MIALLHPVCQLDLLLRENGVGFKRAENGFQRDRGLLGGLHSIRRVIFEHADGESFARFVAGAERHEHMAARRKRESFRQKICKEPVDVCVRNIDNDFTGLLHTVHLLNVSFQGSALKLSDFELRALP